MAVKVDSVCKTFRARRTWREFARHPFMHVSVPVLDHVSFNVRKGEFFGLLGPNGAGKTTLFRVLATSVLPDAGTATIHEHDVAHDSTLVRALVNCVTTNERSLYWRLSAIENLRLFAALYGLRGRAAHQRISEVHELVGLCGTGSKMVGTFSSGMRQRLLIARALLPRPRLLLLDEPTRSLDPIAARDFRRFLRSGVATAEGCTVLLATHSSEEALDLCDRLAVLHRGRLLACGSPKELQRRFGDRSFSVWTRTPDHRAFSVLAEEGNINITEAPVMESEGWWRLRLTIGRGTLDDASMVLHTLSSSGAPIARFEQAELQLAELLERAVRQRGNPE